MIRCILADYNLFCLRHRCILGDSSDCKRKRIVLLPFVTGFRRFPLNLLFYLQGSRSRKGCGFNFICIGECSRLRPICRNSSRRSPIWRRLGKSIPRFRFRYRIRGSRRETLNGNCLICL